METFGRHRGLVGRPDHNLAYEFSNPMRKRGNARKVISGLRCGLVGCKSGVVQLMTQFTGTYLEAQRN